MDNVDYMDGRLADNCQETVVWKLDIRDGYRGVETGHQRRLQGCGNWTSETATGVWNLDIRDGYRGVETRNQWPLQGCGN